LRRLEGPVPLNVWLHDGAHWHLEVLPRITILAGLELGAGVFVNALPPEEAAGRLSGALANDEDRLADDPPDDSAAIAGV
jgi:galactose-1-phosphate uridylyltransferase